MNEMDILEEESTGKRTALIVVAIILVLAVGGFFAVKKFVLKPSGDEAAPVVAEGQVAPAPDAPAAEGDAAIAPNGAPKAPDLTADASGLSKAVVVMKTTKGTVKFKMYSNDAPNTVKRFVELVQAKFFDGLAFHRVVPEFVVQAGDPKSRNKNDPEIGTGGSGVKIKAEFNDRKHVRGTVAMARSLHDPDSADSQFYFSLGAFPHLDKKYTVIGQVVDFGEKVGEKDVLDRIRPMDEIVEMYAE